MKLVFAETPLNM